MEVYLVKADGGIMFNYDLKETNEQTRLDKMQRAVNENKPNGLIQYASTPFENTKVIVNEEGMYKNFKINIIASSIAQQNLLGDAIIQTTNPEVIEWINKVVSGFSQN